MTLRKTLMSDGMVSYVCYDAIKLLDVSIVTYHEPTYPVCGWRNVAILIFFVNEVKVQVQVAS